MEAKEDAAARQAVGEATAGRGDLLAQVFRERDRFARHCGIELLEVGAGRATARMHVQEYHFNAAGSVHGGALFALADVAFAAASNSHGIPATGVNVTMAYTKAARGGVLTARAEELHCGARLGTYSVRITDESGDLVASFQGMVYRKSAPGASPRETQP